MREKIIELLKQEKHKKCSIKELREILEIDSSEDIIELMKTMNQLTDEVIVIENSDHEFALIENTKYVVGRLTPVVIDADKIELMG